MRRAGLPDATNKFKNTLRDHPRSRGVYLASVEVSDPEPRIIPARAGFTLRRHCVRVVLWDHPRSRGVYVCLTLFPKASEGSSPLARGLLRAFKFVVVFGGIIPARAGFTSALSVVSLIVSDHPRSRGVYPLDPRAAAFIAGSSPLARGLHDSRPLQAIYEGIIPARAGFTPTHKPRYRIARDHPRSRGVYAMASTRLGSGSGSSPLARGLLVYERDEDGDERIIPARAGFTSSPGCPGPSWRDHPRSRGVYPEQVLFYSVNAGSSPLARGLPEPSG